MLIEQKKNCAIYGEGTLNGQTCRKWFSKFPAGDFSLKDAPQSDSPVVDEIVSDKIETLLDDQRYISAEISNILKMSLSRWRPFTPAWLY